MMSAPKTKDNIMLFILISRNSFLVGTYLARDKPNFIFSKEQN